MCVSSYYKDQISIHLKDCFYWVCDDKLQRIENMNYSGSRY